MSSSNTSSTAAEAVVTMWFNKVTAIMKTKLHKAQASGHNR